MIFEVSRKIKKDRGEEKALEARAHLENTTIRGLDADMSLAAADLSLKTGLGTVDSIIYATASRFDARFITRDHHFEKLSNVLII